MENAIDIFEAKTNNFVTGLFMFDNAPSHQKQAPDALSARKMLKNPNQRWMNMKGEPRMWNGWYMNGSDKISQDFSQMITLNFLVGLRAWRTSSVNKVFGQMKD